MNLGEEAREYHRGCKNIVQYIYKYFRISFQIFEKPTRASNLQSYLFVLKITNHTSPVSTTMGNTLHFCLLLTVFNYLHNQTNTQAMIYSGCQLKHPPPPPAPDPLPPRPADKGCQ